MSDDNDGYGYDFRDEEGNYGYENDDEENSQNNKYNYGSRTTNSERVRSVLEAKRIHMGPVIVIGKIVTRSDMYVLEVSNGAELIHRDARFIQLEDVEKLDENERLDVILYDDLIENVVPGEVVQIGGNILIENKSRKSIKKIVVVHATSIEYVNRKDLVITSKHIEAFEIFAKLDCEVEGCQRNLLKRLIAMFAPNVIGHDDVKLGLLRSIVGGDKGGDGHGRSDNGFIDTFMVGDHGTAKSTLGAEATKIKPNSRHVSAPHATTKSITGIVDTENEGYTLRLGSIPLAKNAICAIDEITAFPPEEQARLLDILQEREFDLEKHGRHFKIPAPTTIVATANPIQSRWSDRDRISNDEVPIYL